MPISSPNPMFNHLLESSHQDDSKKWSTIGFGEEMTQIILIELILCILSGALYTGTVASISVWKSVPIRML